jgi:hypothetical protein
MFVGQTQRDAKVPFQIVHSQIGREPIIAQQLRQHDRHRHVGILVANAYPGATAERQIGVGMAFDVRCKAVWLEFVDIIAPNVFAPVQSYDRDGDLTAGGKCDTTA